MGGLFHKGYIHLKTFYNIFNIFLISLRKEYVKRFMSRFVTNTGSRLVLTFFDLEVKKIGKWSEKSTFHILTPFGLFNIGMKLWEKAVLQQDFTFKLASRSRWFKLNSPRRYVISVFLFLRNLPKEIYQKFLYFQMAVCN